MVSPREPADNWQASGEGRCPGDDGELEPELEPDPDTDTRFHAVATAPDLC